VSPLQIAVGAIVVMVAWAAMCGAFLWSLAKDLKRP
jgi:hypothetical protein